MQRIFAASFVLRALQCLSVSMVVFVVVPASANDPAIEKQAQSLQKKAIEEDSLNVNYPAAINKLQTALGKCAGNKCGSALRAALLRDVGAMQVLNGAIDEGRGTFLQALSIDASLELDPAYKTAMLQDVWLEAKKKAASGNDVVAGTGNPPVTGSAAAGGPASSATAGGTQPSAGDSAHQAASEATECPPGLPGCNAVKKHEGEDCENGRECQSNSCRAGKCLEKKAAGESCEKDEDCIGDSCGDGKCASAKKSEREDCDRDDECASGSCKEAKCAAAMPGSTRSEAPRLWIGIAASLDFFLMPAATEVCRLNSAGSAPINSQGYNCVDANSGANFPRGREQNAAIQPRQGDTVQSGLGRGNLRLLISMDYALDPNMLLGLRVGYVSLTDPASAPGPAFAPLHVEGRFTYLFGRDALNKVAPMVFLGAGAGEFDAYVATTVAVSGKAMSENAWLVAGPAFVAIGAGARVPLGKTVAATGAVKTEGAFGGTAGFLFGLAPELGVQLGF